MFSRQIYDTKSVLRPVDSKQSGTLGIYQYILVNLVNWLRKSFNWTHFKRVITQTLLTLHQSLKKMILSIKTLHTSVLLNISKISEKLMQKPINNYITNYLSRYLSGYREGYNTQQVLVSFTKKWNRF